MAFTGMRRCTGCRILTGNRKHVFVDMVFMGMVHVPVVQKVGVAVVLNSGMAAGVIVLMNVWGMRRVTHQGLLYVVPTCMGACFANVSASSYNNVSVSSHPMQASVIETPYSNVLPVPQDCLPGLRLLSIKSPKM